MESKYPLIDCIKIPLRYLAHRFIIFTSSTFGKNCARFFIRHVKFPRDIKIRLGKDMVYVNTWDRFVAVLLSKYSLLENIESKILDNIIKEGMTVLDIGANIGLYTLKLARLVGPTGKVWAFEPDQNNYSLLTKNVNANKYHNVSIVKKAIADKTGVAQLFISEENKGDHRIFSEEERVSIPIETITLDSLFPNEKIDFIKIDIQGAEYLALMGMSEIIRKNKNLIILSEFAPNLLKNSGFSGQQLLNKIADFGFRLRYVNDRTRQIELATEATLLDLCKGNNYITLYLKR